VNRLQKIALIALLLVSVSSLLSAQGGATGAISGTLLDPHGAVIAAAKVSIISQATGQTLRELTTDNSGTYSAPLLPAGTYSVEVSAPGFATTKINGVVVRVTETARLSSVLKPSAVKEEVEVHSDVVAIDTTNATTGGSVDEVTIVSLPLATRNFQQLLDLSAGASATLNSAASLGRGDVRIDVNGGREDNNNYQIEGISVADYSFGELTYTPVPSPDSIQEFKVGTSLYDATQGRNGGGNINAILKSGTSNFHGDAWEYFRNTALDADDYFIGKFTLKQNIFGGDVGGPLGSKAKLGFVYLNYQGTRQRSGDSAGTYISGAPVPVLPTVRNCATLTAALFPTGLPAYASPTGCALDPVALALLTAPDTTHQFGNTPGNWLFPSVPSGSFSYSNPGKYNDDQFTTNWDRDFNHGKDRVSFRFFWSDSAQYQPFGADNLQVQTGYPASPTPSAIRCSTSSASASMSSVTRCRTFPYLALQQPISAFQTAPAHRTCTASSSPTACSLVPIRPSFSPHCQTLSPGSIPSVGRRASTQFASEVSLTTLPFGATCPCLTTDCCTSFQELTAL
jgi:hypothetical protein